MMRTRPNEPSRRSLLHALGRRSAQGRSLAAAQVTTGGARPWHHLSDGSFRNPPGSPKGGGSLAEWAAFGWRRVRLSDYMPDLPPGHVLAPAEVVAGLRRAAGKDSLTWLGHASFLIRLGGRTILTDPFLSERASPSADYGPRRYVPPGLAPEALPPIDLLLLSHDHYDHLDLRTLARMGDLSGTTLVAPLGLSRHLAAFRFGRVVELDWLESATVAGLQVRAIPAIHFSKRSLFDRNRSLWCGFRVEAASGSLGFTGDTAYGPVFAELGRTLPGPDLLLVPIGAYAPEHMMRDVHCTPEEAVRIGQDLQARRLCAMHWGTIKMTDEPPFEVPGRFRAAAAEAGFGPEAAWLLAIGETRLL